LKRATGPRKTKHWRTQTKRSNRELHNLNASIELLSKLDTGHTNTSYSLLQLHMPEVSQHGTRIEDTPKHVKLFFFWIVATSLLALDGLKAKLASMEAAHEEDRKRREGEREQMRAILLDDIATKKAEVDVEVVNYIQTLRDQYPAVKASSTGVLSATPSTLSLKSPPVPLLDDDAVETQPLSGDPANEGASSSAVVDGGEGGADAVASSDDAHQTEEQTQS